MIYLDHAASTPVIPEAKEAWLKAAEIFGNPSSLHPLGRQAARVLRSARIEIADVLGIEPEGIIFTASGSEANNLLLHGIKHKFNSVHSSSIEHASVHFALEKYYAGKVKYLPSLQDGTSKVPELTADDLLCLIRVNNETGVIQNAEYNSKALRFCDYTQALGKIEVSPKREGVSLASFSGHKIGAPRGSAFAWRSSEIVLEPFILGGSQEWQLRAGTEDIAAACALAAAVKLSAENIEAKRRSLSAKMSLALEELSKIEDVHVNGDPQKSGFAVLNFSAEGIDGDVLQIRLGDAGLCVSTGSACSSGAAKPSRVLTAMGFDSKRIKSAIRISWIAATPEDEIRDGVILIKETIRKMRQEKKHA